MKKNTSNKNSGVGVPQSFRLLNLLACCCLLLMFSCKARKPLVKRVAVDSTAIAANNLAAKLNAIRVAQLSFNTFSAKAKTKLTIGGSSNDVTLNFRIARDQKIWVSITAIAGIEVARALITPDSIMVINRLQSLYIRKPFSYLYAFAGKQVDYKMLESLFVGNAIPALINKNAGVQPSGGGIILTGNLNDLVFKLLLGSDMKVNQTNLDDQTAGQSLQVNNSAFIQADNRIVPSQIDIASIVKNKKIGVNLHYVKIEFDRPLDYPFSIPARYTAEN